WGGFWFWDPVENASFMPWLVAAALLHSAIVVEKRNALKIWTVLLAILAFSLSLVGTFLVRSGVLTSVHAFAVDPTRGVFILMILLVAMARGPWLAPFGVALGLWLVLGAAVEIAERTSLFRSPLATSWSRLKGLPRSSFGMTLAHAGLGLAVIGIFAVTAWREEHIVAMKPGDHLNVAGYDVTYPGEAPMTGPNY